MEERASDVKMHTSAMKRWMYVAQFTEPREGRGTGSILGTYSNRVKGCQIRRVGYESLDRAGNRHRNVCKGIVPA